MREESQEANTTNTEYLALFAFSHGQLDSHSFASFVAFLRFLLHHYMPLGTLPTLSKRLQRGFDRALLLLVAVEEQDEVRLLILRSVLRVEDPRDLIRR